jgi:hypothetical protein
MERKQLILAFAGIFILFLMTFRLHGQKLIYEKKVDSVLVPGKVGPNRLHYYQMIFGTATMVPQWSPASSDYRFPLSGNLWVGGRYKLKMTRSLALVGEGGIRHTTARIRQSEGKVFPDSLLHLKQIIKSDDIFGGLFLRIRFGQKGDYLGNYLDAGIQGAWLFNSRLVEVDKQDGDLTGWYARRRTAFSGLEFMKPFTWQLVTRIGFGSVAVIATYRPKALITVNTGHDLPPLTMGVEFSPVRY